MKLSLPISVLILICASVAAAQTKAQETPPKTQEAPKTQDAPKPRKSRKTQEAAKTQETAPAAPATQTLVTESKVPVPPATPTTDAESKISAPPATATIPTIDGESGVPTAPGAPTAVMESKVPAPPASETAVTESKVPVAGHPVASAKEVKNLYIEPMADDLDQSLRAEISKQLAGRIVLVSKPEDADAVMTGIGEWRNGTAEAVTERLPGPHGARGAVQVLSKGMLWTSQAWGLLRGGNQRKVADRIVHNFKNALAGKDTSESPWFN